VTLQPITDELIPDTVALLSRGFPRPPAFWQTRLRRLAEYHRKTGGRPIGQLMRVDGRPVGVILTIASRRRTRSQQRDVVNLSSWYIEEPHRWLAARMLSRVIADDSVTYTDLSPSLEAMKLNEQLGFHTATRGIVLFFLPWTAVTRRARGEVVPYEHLPKGALAHDDDMVVQHHRDFGSVAAALRCGDTWHPLLFHPVRRKGVPVARSVLAPSQRLLADNVAGISRFLLRRGMLFLSLHGGTAIGGIPWNRSAPVQVKGKWESDGVDHAYSEIVFLRV
jgi:hypothetical protein